MCALRTASLVCLLLAGVATSVEADEPLPGIARFTSKARLDAQPDALESSRFTVRAYLTLTPSPAPAGKPGLSIRAKLEPQSKALCEGPGFIFGDGFEAP